VNAGLHLEEKFCFLAELFFSLIVQSLGVHSQCSPHELAERQGTYGVHPLEATVATRFLGASARVMDPAKAVKKYTRSAAGTIALAHDVRPAAVLATTVIYLLGPGVFGNEAFPFSVRYGYIADRLLAVRQDATMQDLATRRALPKVRVMFESMGRFYIFAQARLGGPGGTLQGFDATLNIRSLQTCLTSVLAIHQSCCDSKVKGEFVAYQLLMSCLVGGSQGVELADAASIPVTSALAFAKRTALCVCSSNYAEFFQNFAPLDHTVLLSSQEERALFLSRCLALELTDHMRKMALNIMNAAYNKTDKFPISKLRRILRFESEDATTSFCARAGVVVHHTSIDAVANSGFSFAQFHVTKRLSPERELTAAAASEDGHTALEWRRDSHLLLGSGAVFGETSFCL
jgi:hypothetical protein